METQVHSIQEIKIFISSPGDVTEEREIAKSVINKLRKEYAKIATIKPILWEDLPLTTACSFQEGINAVLEENGVDIAVFILANRLGSNPGNNFCYPDGTAYRSGTEYEYDFMQNLRNKTGKPEILVYIKKKDPQKFTPKGSFERIKEAYEQNELVKNFIKERFEDKELGTFLAYHELKDDVNFASRLTEHLRGLLQKILNSPEIPRYKGNPYKGLLSFEPEDESIFFGRGVQLELLESQIIQFYADKQEIPFIFICGESGSGKSSFAKAGLIPDLLRTGILASHKCAVKIFTPQQTQGNFCKSLLNYLQEMLPELRGNKYFATLYQKENISNQDAAIIFDAINRTNTDTQNFLPVFLIDQFEDFFTDSRLSEQEKEKGIAWLSALQQTGKIMVIFTLRSDYYHHMTSNEGLRCIKSNSIVYDIARLTASELREIIDEPMRASGMQWEKDPRSGEQLNDIVFNEALKLQSLPLLEFALTDLFENRKENLLTCAHYYKNGGLNGAIENYANNVFNSFSAAQKQIFFRLLSLVTTTDHAGNLCRRGCSSKEYNFSEPEKQVLNTLVVKRLFSISTDDQGNGMFFIAHDFLLQHWQCIKEWGKKSLEFFERQKQFEIKAERWLNSNKSTDYLLENMTELEEAEDLLVCHDQQLPRLVKSFLLESIKKKQKKWRWLSTFFFSFLLYYIIVSILSRIVPNITLPLAENTVNCTFMEFLTAAFLILFLLIRKWLIFSAIIKRYIWEMCCWGAGAILFLICSLKYNNPNIIANYLVMSIFLFSLFIFNLIRLRFFILRKKGRRSFIQPSKMRKVFFQYGSVLLIVFFFSLINQTNQENLKQLQQKFESVLFAYEGGMHYEINQHVVDVVEQKLIKLVKENKNPDQIAAMNYFFAKACYAQGLPEKALKYGFTPDPKNVSSVQLYQQLQNELMHTAEAFYWSEQIPGFPGWERVWLALKSGDVNKAAGVAIKLQTPAMSIASTDWMNYAHYLLLVKKDTVAAIMIYKAFIGQKLADGRSWNNELLTDFVHLKKHRKFLIPVLLAEKQINLQPLPVSLESGINVAKDLPRLCGTWHVSNSDKLLNFVGSRINFKVTSSDIIPVYWEVLQKKQGRSNLLSRSYMHMKVNKHGKEQYLLELHEPRSGTFTLWILTFNNKDSFNAKVLYSLSRDLTGKTLEFYRSGTCTCAKH